MIRVQPFWWVGAALQDKESRRIGVSAGLGSGKTHGRMQWHFAQIIQNKGAPISGELWPTYQKVADAAIPIARKVLSECGYKEHSHYHIIKSPYPKLIFDCLKPAHEIHYLSAEHPERIVAVEYSHASVDEAGIISGEARDALFTRCRAKGYSNQQLEVGAPQGVNDFANDFDSDTLPNWEKVTELERVNTLRKRRHIILWTEHNPHLPEGYLASLYDVYGHNPALIQSYVFGKFCPLQVGAVYSNYLPQKHDIEDIHADPYRDINLCWDFNANPLAWVAVQRQAVQDDSDILSPRKFRYAVIDEANEGFGQMDDSCAEFAVKFPVEIFRDTKIKIYGDRTGHAQSHKIKGSDFEAIQNYLKALGFSQVEITASRQVAPEAGSVDSLQRLFLNNLIYVCKRCRMFRKSLMATRWKEGQRKIEKPSGETHTHHSDAVKYWAYQETRYETGTQKKTILGLHRQI